MKIAEKLKKSIEEALSELGISGVSFSLEHPTELSHGDYATNVSMVCAKQLGKNPKEVAGEIAAELERNKIPEIEKIELAGPGFINFTLSQNFFSESIQDLVKLGDDFGKLKINAGKKILVEHSSPNLFKPFHIGHMMNNAIGESLTRMMKYSGAKVETMSFPSDISLGVAKAIFILIEKYGNEFSPSEISILGDAYVEGTKRYEDDESIQDRVKEIADNLYAGNDSVEVKIFEACKKFNIAYFETITKKLGSHFDSYIYESEAGIIGKELVEKNTPDIFTRSDGAIVYIPDESKKNLNTAVFINSQGNPTYEAKDLGLLDLKFDKIDPETSIFVTDHQQIHHFEIVMDAAAKINSVWADRSVHIPHGRMSFKGQKMSSRLGGVPLVTEILDLVSEEVKLKSSGREQVSDPEVIAIAAIKFAILRVKPGQNINFDPETSLSFEGDSGPYLQYTHARISSVLEKASEADISAEYKNGEEVTNLERLLFRLPEVVESAISEYAPQYIVTYLLEIARAFNSFYAEKQIIDSENIEISGHRLAIAQATQIVLKNGLGLLGIIAPERM